jgi:hypothetical protein
MKVSSLLLTAWGSPFDQFAKLTCLPKQAFFESASAAWIFKKQRSVASLSTSNCASCEPYLQSGGKKVWDYREASRRHRVGAGLSKQHHI